MDIDEVGGLDVSGGELAKVHLVEAAAYSQSIKAKPRIDQTYTTLVGWEIRKRRTAQAMRRTTTSSFHSPEERLRPPVACALRPGRRPLETASRRSSASRWSWRGWGKRGVEWEESLPGGEGCLRTRTLPDMARVDVCQVVAAVQRYRRKGKERMMRSASERVERRTESGEEAASCGGRRGMACTATRAGIIA